MIMMQEVFLSVEVFATPNRTTSLYFPLAEQHDPFHSIFIHKKSLQSSGWLPKRCQLQVAIVPESALAGLLQDPESRICSFGP